MKRKLRSIVKTFHIWAGLSLGLFFCLMGASGSLLVFRTDIEAALRPRWIATSAARPASPLLEAERNLRQRWAQAEITRITFPETPREPYEFQVRLGKQQLHVFIDSDTGEVLGTYELPWLEWITALHHDLQLGPVGRQLAGLIGIGLFGASLTGIVVWLLRNPTWKSMISVSWRGPSKRRNLELHRSTGLISNALLLLLSFTGICLAYPQTFRAIVEALVGAPPEKGLRVRVNQSALGRPLSVYAQTALSTLPGSSLRELRLPQSTGRPVTARLWRSSDLRREGSSQVSMDPASAHVLFVDSSAKWELEKRFVQSITPLHYGEWGGSIVKWLWAAAGLMPVALFISGFLIWLAPYREKRKTQAAVRQQEVAVPTLI